MPIEQPQSWPAIAGWLPDQEEPLRKVIVIRCFHDVGICEVPPGSNRSGRIDGYNRRAGSPIASYWCASWATAVWVDCGADVPPSARASCDMVYDWAESEGLLKPRTATPEHGDFVLYGGGGTRANGKPDATHIGIVIRASPYLISCEGNTSWGGAFSRNGEAIVVKRIDTKRVVGYVSPQFRAEMRKGVTL